MIWVGREAKNFARQGWTAKSLICPSMANREPPGAFQAQSWGEINCGVLRAAKSAGSPRRVFLAVGSASAHGRIRCFKKGVWTWRQVQ
jgi:hypothetical protein